MKKLAILLLIILSGTVLFAQTIIPKKANTIIISGDLNQADFYAKIADILFDNGYGLQSSDKALGSLTTTSRGIKSGNFQVMFTVLVKDNKATLRGQWKSEELKFDWLIIEYGGQKGSMKMITWNEMINLANQIPGTKEYLIK